jgi:hypothetical protein
MKTQAKVIIEKNKTSFNVNVGVGQDDVFISYFVQLSSGLYYKNQDIRRNTSTVLVQINA